MSDKNPLEFTKNRQKDIKLLNKNSEFSLKINEPNSSFNWYWCIRNHISSGSPKEALLIYTRIHRKSAYLLSVVPLIFKACASLSMIHCGKALHSESIKVGLESDVVVGTSLVDVYGKCGYTDDARKVFDGMPVKNVVTWNAMVGGYMRNGDTEPAVQLFEQMSVRTTVSWIEMIEGYGRRGDTVTARYFFNKVPLELRNVVTWTVMIDGYTSNGEMEAAKEMFDTMPERNFFVWSTMVSGYFKKGDIQEGKAMFERIPVKNLVNWNSLISGYCQNGLCEEALDAFAKMQTDGFEPDEISLTSALSACARLGSLEAGKTLHQMIIQRRIRLNKFILNGLVDMYAKCGDLTNAKLIFEGMSERNDSCWNSMISGFSIHGKCEECIEFFDRMEKSNMKPNEITFLSVLSACGHAGFIQHGLETFSKMEKYGLSANIKHYGCLIDLLGRAGRLKDAYDIISKMPMKPNHTVWGALLGACRVHSDMDMANHVLEKVRMQDSGDSSCYVLMSNIYASSERWEKAESVRMVMSSKGLPKTTGRSSVMLDSARTAMVDVPH